jgi:HAD superfamily hydrolase (TIGR01509 family)
MPTTVIIDIDGTLVDTNYQHALAWYRAFRAHGHTVQTWQAHRHIGMGGDQLVEALIGEEAAAERGDAIREFEAEAYAEMIDEVQPLQGAGELLADLDSRGFALVLASSAKQEEVDHYLDLLNAREVVDAWTTAADVEHTKPEPDLVQAALAKADRAEGEKSLMIGDSVWDIKAAKKVGVPTLTVLTGGFSEDELREAGAAHVIREVAAIRDDLELIERLAAAT